jgi:hypothetical protein
MINTYHTKKIVNSLTPHKASPLRPNGILVKYVVYSPLLSHKHQVALGATHAQMNKKMVLKPISKILKILTSMKTSTTISPS